MRNRVVIERVSPEIDNGLYFIKRTPGELVNISAGIFSDGHDYIRASVLYKHESEKKWSESFLQDHINDEWTGSFKVEKRGFYEYKIEAWVDHLYNWHKGFIKKEAAGQDMSVELQIGADLLRRTAANYTKAKAEPITKMAALLENKAPYIDPVAQVLSPGFKQLVHDYPYKQFQNHL